MNLFSLLRGIFGFSSGKSSSDFVNEDWSQEDKDREYTDIGGSLSNLLAKWTGSRLTNAEREANAFSAQQSALSFQREADFSREMFAKQTDLANTAYQRQVNDMQAAGLNPMLALGAGGASAPSVMSASSSPASSVAPGSANLGALLEMFQLGSRLKNMRADTKLKEADAEVKQADAEVKRAEADNKLEDTRSKRLQNDYFEEVRDMRKQGEQLSNDLTKAQWKSVWKQMDVMQSEITRNIEQAHSEQEKQSLYVQQAILASEQADNLIKMRPFVQAAMSAQTEKDRALAKVAAIDEAYRQGLIDNGAIQAAIRLDNANASKSEIEAKAKAFAQAIKDGSLRKSADDSGDWRSSVIAGLYEALNMASSALQGKL